MRHVLVLIALVAGLAACSSPDAEAPSAQAMDVPAGAESGEPHLYTDAEGTLWMSWVAPVDSVRHALRYATFDGASWSAPQTATQGTDWFVNWADVPSIRPLPDGRIAAHYLKSSSGSNIVYAYDVRIVQTAADGTWQPAFTPHRDSTATEHGFASLLPWDDNLLAVWLDGRNTNLSGEGDGGAMTLRAALLTPEGAIRQPTQLDDRTCDCCPTSAVRTSAGALVAYRGRTEDEIRDIRLVRFDGTSWSEPYTLHADGWHISGCPVNGPALAAEGDRVVAAWFTGANGTPRVKAAFSSDGGREFSDPLVLDSSAPVGRVDAVLLDDGSALVSWLDSGSEDGFIRVRHIRPDGSMATPITLTAASTSRGTGMPRMVRSGDDLYIAWVDDEADRVRMARTSVSAIQ
jgi:hypothetical protein